MNHILAIFPIENVGSEDNVQMGSNIDIPTALLISLIAVVVVIAILALIILLCDWFFKGIDKADNSMHINAKKENKILDEDEDAAVALIAATIDFHKETGKDCRVRKIERID